jgi:hypothetical protein
MPVVFAVPLVPPVCDTVKETVMRVSLAIATVLLAGLKEYPSFASSTVTV